MPRLIDLTATLDPANRAKLPPPLAWAARICSARACAHCQSAPEAAAACEALAPMALRSLCGQGLPLM